MMCNRNDEVFDGEEAAKKGRGKKGGLIETENNQDHAERDEEEDEDAWPAFRQRDEQSDDDAYYDPFENSQSSQKDKEDERGEKGSTYLDHPISQNPNCQKLVNRPVKNILSFRDGKRRMLFSSFSIRHAIFSAGRVSRSPI